MTEFKDANGKTWRLHLTIEAIDNINVIINSGRPEGERPFDLLCIADESGGFDAAAINSLFINPRRLASVLAEAVQWARNDEAEGKELANGMRDDAVRAAGKAFMEELATFFEDSRRPFLRAMLGAVHKATDKGAELSVRVIESSMNLLPDSASLEAAAT